MAELLLELFSEEIPARMQTKAEQELLRLLKASLSSLGGNIEGEAWVTPRRLGVYIKGIPLVVPAFSEELRGTKTSAPEAALEGFLRKNNLDKSQLTINGEYYYATINKPETKVEDVLGGMITDTIKNFTWPKSMRWGDKEIKWVRPLHNILCLFDGKILPLSYGHINSSNFTFGHRFMAPEKLIINNFENYKDQLGKSKVILTAEARKEKVREDIASAIAGKQLELIDDKGLFDEIAGLVEYPFVLLGEIDLEFMDLPKEVLVITLKHHQRYLMLNDLKGNLAPYFIIVANRVTDDGGAEIIRGNSKVLRARLSDAKFFYEGDKQQSLASRLEELKRLTFYKDLGSVYDKTQRVKEIAQKVARLLGVDELLAARAAELCKADLVTNMVKEFPELQGIMGYYYAIHDGENKDVAMAIRDHYKPQGPSDSLPENKLGAIVAIADKIDTLQEMFKIGIKPTGSKDPFALRRAAIGIFRIISEHKLDLNPSDVVSNSEVLAFIEDKRE